MLKNPTGPLSHRSALLARRALICAWLLVFTISRPVSAQLGLNGSNEPSIFNVLMSAPREESRPLAVAQKALEENDLNEAIYQLGIVLGILPEIHDDAIDAEVEDFFVGPFDEPLTRKSLKLEAQKLIGQLPPKGRQLFENRYGYLAKKLLNQSVDQRDMTKIAEVSRLFFYTEAGNEATLLMGRYHLDQGRPIAAALVLQRLADVDVARDRYDPELSLLLATCYAYADMPEKAKDVLVELKSRRPSSSVSIAGSQVALFHSDDDAVNWLRQIVGSFRPITLRTPSEWTVFRGDAARNSPCAGGMPLSTLRWEVPLVDKPDETPIERIRKQYDDKNWAVIPSLQPLAVDNWVLLRTPNRLIGIDFETGKRKWVYPWDDPHFGGNGSPGSSVSNMNSPRESQLNQRIFDDIPYGHMSSNGRSVYLIDNLGYVMRSGYSSQVIIRAGGLPQDNPDWPRDHNTLTALDLRGQGKQRWVVGGVAGEEPKLDDAFFLGAPLPLFGELYALAEIDSEISLVVLDEKTGQLRWRQQIASVESNNIVTDSSRRLAGASPSFADGVLVCPTSSGAVVAIDLSSRTLLWGFQFPRANYIRQSNGFGTTIRTNNRYVGNRWADSTVIIADGRVILTPVESEKAFCLDLLTGQSQWSGGIDREDLLFVACVHDGKVIFVGKSEMRAIQLKDGKQAWKTDLGNGAMPSGRGYLSDGYYFLPTNDAQLLKVDAVSGKIVKRISTNGVLGNLICYKGDVISLSADKLKVFRQESPLRAQVKVALERNPDDPWALARQGELLLLDEQYDEAVEVIRRAYALSGQADDVRLLLGQAVLSALGKDYAANADLSNEIEELLDAPDQLARFLRLKAQRQQEAGNHLEAFQIYQRLVATGGGQGTNGTADLFAIEQISRNVDVRRGRWLRARFVALLEEARTDDRLALNAAIEAHFSEATKHGSIQKLKEFVELFSSHALARQAELLLSDRLRDAGELLQAEQTLLSLVGNDDAKIAGQATARLARLLEGAGQSVAAAKYYEMLQRSFADVECLGDKTGAELFRKASENYLLGDSWKGGRTHVEQSADNVISTPSYLRIYPIGLRQVSESSPRGLQLAFDQRSSEVFVRDGRGESICRLPLKRSDGRNFYASNYAVTYARARGHLLLISVGYQLVAVDLFQAAVKPDDAILWRLDLTEAVPPPPGQSSTHRRVESVSIATPWGRKLYRATDEDGKLIGVTSMLSRNGICYLRHSELVCVDPATGNTLWSRGRIEPGSDLSGDGEVVLVLQNKGNEAQVYSMIDGAPLGTRDLSSRPNRWSDVGRTLLCWQEQNDKLTLEMYDPWLNNTVWSHDFAMKSRGDLVAGEEVAVLQPDGEFFLLSLRSGKPRIRARLQPETELASIHTIRSADQYLLITNKNAIDYDEKRKIQPAPHGFQTPLIGGRVYAFDRATGQPLWQVPAEIDQYGLPLDQPAEVPVLTFIRHATPTVDRGPRRTQTSVLCIDRRDGRILLQEENIPAATHTYRVVGRPAKNLLQVQLPGRSFTFRFTEDPVPPEPPAQTGPASSLATDDSKINLGRVTNAIMNAFP